MSKNILAFESSCDETSVALLKDFEVMKLLISSQKIHNEFGGIVPELASRIHITNINHLTDNFFQNSEIKKNNIDLVAATQGPGLIGSILVGYNFAKSFAISLGIPFLPVNHIESHIYSCFISQEEIEFPFLSLVVSGGHTLIYFVDDYFKHKLIGQTQDDAAGEAFDKVAKMLGLTYPGGPIIDELAKDGDENFHEFPVSEIKGKDYDFSFSGIKTSVLYFLRKNFSINKLDENELKNICASFQKAIVKDLFNKTYKAASQLGIKTICISGGVSANTYLRKRFTQLEKNNFKILFPEKKYSTDNAAMVGYTAYLASKFSKEFKSKIESSLFEQPFPRLDIKRNTPERKKIT